MEKIHTNLLSSHVCENDDKNDGPVEYNDFDDFVGDSFGSTSPDNNDLVSSSELDRVEQVAPRFKHAKSSFKRTCDAVSKAMRNKSPNAKIHRKNA